MNLRNVSALAVVATLAGSQSPPVFLQWPLPAAGKAYGSIDGARLWQHVKDHGDIAERACAISPAGC